MVPHMGNFLIQTAYIACYINGQTTALYVCPIFGWWWTRYNYLTASINVSVQLCLNGKGKPEQVTSLVPRNTVVHVWVRVFSRATAVLAWRNIVLAFWTGSKELYCAVGHFPTRGVSVPEGSKDSNLPVVSSVKHNTHSCAHKHTHSLPIRISWSNDNQKHDSMLVYAWIGRCDCTTWVRPQTLATCVHEDM